MYTAFSSTRSAPDQEGNAGVIGNIWGWWVTGEKIDGRKNKATLIYSSWG